MGNNPSAPKEKVLSVKSSYTDEEINANIARLLAETQKNVPQAVSNADTETLALSDTVVVPMENNQAGGSKRYRQFVDSMMETTENNQAGGSIVTPGNVATPMSATSAVTPNANTDLKEISEFSEFRRIKEYVINNAINSTETATMTGGAKKTKSKKSKTSKNSKKASKSNKSKKTKSAKIVSPFSESSLPSTSPDTEISSHSGGFSPTSTNVFASTDMENLNKTSTYNSNSDSEYNIHPFYSESSDVSSRFPHSVDRF